MKYKCPYCGNEIKLGIYCNACLQRVDCFKEIWEMSAFYYNQGLKASKTRELSLACRYLQKAIILYKYNTEARNLLGLIYCETGQIGNALKEWIISISLEKEENRAAYYIDYIQKQPKFLANSKEGIILYNKALAYVQQKNLDMAMIRLKKAISLSPNLLEARALLALAYIKQGKLCKAQEQVEKVLNIDKGHKMALTYYRELGEEKIEQPEPYERDYTTSVKIRRDVSRVLDTTTYHKRYVCYFVLGALSMFIISKFLMLPSEIDQYKDEISVLQSTKETLSQQIQTLSEEQKVKVADLENQNEKLQSKVTSYESELLVLEQKGKLVKVEEIIKQGDYEEAAQILYSVASTCLEEEDLEVLSSFKETVYPKATERLYSQGVSLYRAENYIEAVMQFETLLQYEPTDRIARQTLYYLGQISEVNQDIEAAKKYYNKIIGEYPSSSDAYKAEESLTRLNESENA